MSADRALTGTLLIVFDGRNILDLLSHYSDGKLPLGVRLLDMGPSTSLGRHLILQVESDQWEDAPTGLSDLNDPRNAGTLAPLHIRYEGKKVMSWGDKRAAVEWKEADSFGRG